MIYGNIFDVKEMAVHDGPGIRTTVFFKGCPLRCRWCHNPEGLSNKPQLMFKENKCLHCDLCKQQCEHEDCKPFGRCLHICPENCLTVTGREIDTETLTRELIESAYIMGNSFGGFTFSGGEPLAQPEFLSELISKLKDYHLCIETSGYANPYFFKTIIEKLQFIIMDIKLADSEVHKEYTGVGNEIILENFNQLKRSGKPYIVRTPLIPNITDTKENLEGIKNIIGNSDWEQLPYNGMAGAKYKMLGMNYNEF